MPGMYKIKSCNYCGKTERMRGKYCSLSCSNLGRGGHSEETKQNISDAMKTPDAIGRRAYSNRQRREATAVLKSKAQEIVPTLSDDDWCVGIPDLDEPDPADIYIKGF